MQTVKYVTKSGLVFALAAMLSACGGAPSDAEVSQALAAQMQQDLKHVSSIPGLAGSRFEAMAASMLPKIDNISPQGCEAAEHDIYNCTVETTITVMGIQQTSMQDFRFKQNKAGEWRLMR